MEGIFVLILAFPLAYFVYLNCKGTFLKPALISLALGLIYGLFIFSLRQTNDSIGFAPVGSLILGSIFSFWAFGVAWPIAVIDSCVRKGRNKLWILPTSLLMLYSIYYLFFEMLYRTHQ